MNQALTVLGGLLTLAGACTCVAQQHTPSEQKGPLPIIPGAAGFGINTLRAAGGTSSLRVQRCTRSKVSQPPVVVPNLEIRPAAEVREWVLATAGARPMDRHPVDARIIREVHDRTGNIPSSQEDVGSWPELPRNHRELELPANPNSDDDGDGDTNLEEWLHGFSERVNLQTDCAPGDHEQNGADLSIPPNGG